jgi:hypothetical protein
MADNLPNILRSDAWYYIFRSDMEVIRNLKTMNSTTFLEWLVELSENRGNDPSEKPVVTWKYLAEPNVKRVCVGRHESRRDAVVESVKLVCKENDIDYKLLQRSDGMLNISYPRRGLIRRDGPLPRIHAGYVSTHLEFQDPDDPVIDLCSRILEDQIALSKITDEHLVQLVSMGPPGLPHERAERVRPGYRERHWEAVHAVLIDFIEVDVLVALTISYLKAEPSDDTTSTSKLSLDHDKFSDMLDQ